MSNLGSKIATAMATEGSFKFAFGPIVGHTVYLLEPPPEVIPAIYGWEVLGRPEGIQTKDIERAFAEFHANPSLWTVIPRFVEAQISATRGRLATINLSPVYLGDTKVQAGLRRILAPRNGLFFQRHPASFVKNITFEIMESAELDDSGIKFLKELRGYGYRLAIDDVGTGAHANVGYLQRIIGELTPYELKIDFNLVRGKELGEVKELTLKWARLVLLPCYSLMMSTPGRDPTIAIEGIPVCPVANYLASKEYDACGKRYIPNFPPDEVYIRNPEQAPAWREMIKEIKETLERELEREGFVGARVDIVGQLAPTDTIGW